MLWLRNMREISLCCGLQSTGGSMITGVGCRLGVSINSVYCSYITLKLEQHYFCNFPSSENEYARQHISNTISFYIWIFKGENEHLDICAWKITYQKNWHTYFETRDQFIKVFILWICFWHSLRGLICRAIKCLAQEWCEMKPNWTLWSQGELCSKIVLNCPQLNWEIL